MILTEFLGHTLGPDYEVALHDLTDTNRSIIAIANGHVSGRKIGAPLTNMALSILKDKSYEKTNYRVQDYGLSINGKQLRSNTLFIKDGAKMIGMLCINFDDSRYQALIGNILSMIHPDTYLNEHILRSSPVLAEASAAQTKPERYTNTTEDVAEDAIRYELEKLGLADKELNYEERMKVISALEADGIFLLKGVIKSVADVFHCSQASVYRYLAQLKGKE